MTAAEGGAGRVPAPGTIDVRAVRRHFLFPGRDRIALNNAASTQPPRELLALYTSLGPDYENVHRGQSSASAAMTGRFEESYDTIARFIGAPGPASIALYRNTTEAINAVMYSLLTEFRDGDNVVTTLMEHNSNYVPWHAMCREILPRFGRRVQCRLARFDPVSGELDLEHLASLIDGRTKLVCCTGASNFLGTRNPLAAVRALADASGYFQPNGERRSWLLIDGAQLVPGSFTDVRALGADYLAFSFHKLLAPFGVGVLYAREQLLNPALPFLYGGDMIAEGRVFPNHVEYNALPWKYSAGTPNILGAVVSAQALRLLLDLALTPKRPAYFGTASPVERDAVRAAMNRIAAWNQMLTSRALDGLGSIDGITIYGPRDARPAHLAGRVQPGRPGSGRRRPGPERGRDRVAGRLPLRHAGPSRARPEPARQLPPQLLPVQHPRRGRPGRGGGGRDRGRTRHLRPPRLRLPVPLLAGRAAPEPAFAVGDRTARACPGGIGMTAVTCPGCGAAAEITERFTLASTDGPVAHVALSCAGGHHYRMAADKLAARPLGPRVIPGPRMRPHTFPLCIRCRVNPAGFWVSGKDTSVVRRPWCLSCCDDLDRELCDMTPFGG